MKASRDPFVAALLTVLCAACNESLPPGPDVAGDGCEPDPVQAGTDASCHGLATFHSLDLADNRIGAVAETGPGGDWIWNTGLKWMRMIVDSYGTWQHADWEAGGYAIDPTEDAFIDALVANGVTVMLVLAVWHPDHRTVFHKSEEDLEIYLSWVRFMVRHFEGRVTYYEILNEPDLNLEAPSGMPVDAYVHLVERTVPVIREEDPAAKIVVGAVPDTRFEWVRDWMWGVLGSEVMATVDGFSWHGMYGAAPSGDPRGVRYPEHDMPNYWENYPGLVRDIQSIAEASGFEGEYLVEEMLWRTPDHAHESEPSGFTDVSGAKYSARAVVIHLGLDVAAGVAIIQAEHGRPWSHGVVRHLSTVLAGARPRDLPVTIESQATKVVHYGFALDDGSTLLALWTDGVAMEEDPLVEARLTLPGPGPERIEGIDVLHGLVQEVAGSVQQGELVLPRILLRDYPLILKLANE